MANETQNYISKHVWSILQCVLGLYCAIFATWEYFNPRQSAASIPQQSAPAQTNGEAMTQAVYAMPLWLWLGIILLVVTVVIPAGMRLFRGLKKKPPSQSSGIVPGIPTLSALLGLNSNAEFNAKQYFALAYYSPITAEIEKNMRTTAQQNSPNDKEAFYARFLGVGIVAYLHDWTWFMIYGSQMRALTELNSRGLIPIADLKKHYDVAVRDYPKTYENYSFDQWVEFMKNRLLIATYPSQMIELSWGGKDFLKYLAHCARDTNGKAH